MGYRITRIERATPVQTPSDEDRAAFQAAHVALVDQLAAAERTGDPVEVFAACEAAVSTWEAHGVWPDNWAAWQRALDDVLPWQEGVSLDEIAAGDVKIDRVD